MRSATLAQIALIAQLRWHLFRNALRTPRAQLELAGQVVLSVLALVVALGIGVGLFGLSWFLAYDGRLAALRGMLWGVFLASQILPVVVAASTASADFGELLRFPLRFPAFVMLNLVYALFDPVALVVLFWLLCVGAGIASARPDTLVWIAPAILGLAAVNVLLNRVILSWLERLLMRRRGREIFFLVLVSGMLLTQLIFISAEDWAEQLYKDLEPYLAVGVVLPPGLAHLAVQFAVQGDVLGTLAPAAGLAGYAYLLFLVLRRRLRAQYRGEDVSEGFTPSQAAAPVEAGWHLPTIPGSMAALVEKEIRYALRNGFVLMNLLVPLFVPAMLGMVSQREDKLPGPFRQDAGALYVASVAYLFVVTVHLAVNHFAFEGRGIQFLLAAPVRFRNVIAAKNVVHASVMVGEATLIWLVLAAFGQPPDRRATAVILSALPFLLLAQLSAGNLLSLHFPRRFDFGRFKQRQSGMSVLLSLLQQVVTLGLAGLVYALARWLDLLWAAAVVYLVLAAAMWQVYKVGLDYCEELASRRREALTAELCHD